MGVQEQIHQYPVQRIRIRRDPAVAIPGRVLRLAQLQAVQCARARQRIPPIPLPGSLRAGQVGLARPERQQAVAAQRVVIVEVFIAQGNPTHPLGDHLQHRVLDLPGVAIIGEAICDALHQRQAAIHLPQQDGAAIGGEPARVETTDDLTAAEGVKFELRGRTLCVHGASLLD